MTASVASVALSCSDSNQRSRIGRAAPVRISAAAVMSLPRLRAFNPSLPSVHRSLRLLLIGSGGTMSSVGSSNAATRSSIASYFGRLSASLVENLLTSRYVICLSGPISR
jgi:hypothetical protein